MDAESFPPWEGYDCADRHWTAQHLTGGRHGGALDVCHHVHARWISTNHMPIQTLNQKLHHMAWERQHFHIRGTSQSCIVLAGTCVKFPHCWQNDGSGKHAGDSCLRLLLSAGRPVCLPLLLPPPVPLQLAALARASAPCKGVRSVSPWRLRLPRIPTALSSLHKEGGKD